MKYRPDIDGLRAIAVLAVLFYHAGISVFSGGYVGVDVFFVISGYLITTKIVQDLKANQFSLISFYEKRIRRIFPALLTVIIITLLIGTLLFDAKSYKELGESAIATTLSLANVLFWTQAGYFDQPSTLKPLLHTWSLSIEEQFYLILPLLLVTLFRFFKSKIFLIITFLFLTSLGLSIYILSKDVDATFFLLQYRAWELLLGSLLALKPAYFKSWQRNLLSLAGILMILTTIVVYSNQTAFPGFAATIPVIGAALIIYSGINGTSFVGKVLSMPPFVFIGKISYSLYLWHWVLIVFGKYYLIRESTTTDIILWLLLIFVISTLSWKFIETPFRDRNFLKRPQIFIFAGGVMTIALAFGFFIYQGQELELRTHILSQGSMSPRSEWDSEFENWAECVAHDGNDFEFPQIAENCLLGEENKQSPSFLVWGDSHAHALTSAVNASASRIGIQGALVSGSGCPPLLDIGFSEMPYCHEYNNQIIDYIKSHPEIETIIFISRWALYAEAGRYKPEEGSSSFLINLGNSTDQEETNAHIFALGLQRTVEVLANLEREIIIVAPVPEIGYTVPTAYSIASRTGRDVNKIIGPTLSEYLERNTNVIPIFEELEKNEKNVQILSPAELLCNDENCMVIKDNTPSIEMMTTYQHLDLIIYPPSLILFLKI